MKLKKYETKNFSIRTHIIIAVTATIVVSILIIGIMLSSIRFFVPKLYDFSSVSTNSYSMQNQLQWGQTMMNIGYQLTSRGNDEEKIESLKNITKDFEKMGTKIYISKNGKEFFSNSTLEEISKDAEKIGNIDLSQKMYFYSDSGVAITNNVKEYKIFITNNEYDLKRANNSISIQEIFNSIFSRTGFIVAITALIFVLIMIISSTIISKNMQKPIFILAKGAEEIAKGNLDYKMEYDSKSELGLTVKAMNDLSAKLKAAETEKNKIDQSRKEMIAGLAHDLRTPLTSIKGYVEGIRDGIANTPEKQQQYIKTIYSSTLDMEKLLNELMDISKLELGKIQLETEPTNIIEFIDEFVEEKMPKRQKYDIDFEYKKPKNVEKINVMLDANRFSRVLSNIATNSLKYTNPSKNIRLELNVENYEKSVIISISDNGIGIDAENLTHIFDTFYRADQARTNSSDGSGIGLAICKEIVELHGGSIWATSKLGEGTTVFISLDKIMED